MRHVINYEGVKIYTNDVTIMRVTCCKCHKASFGRVIKTFYMRAKIEYFVKFSNFGNNSTLMVNKKLFFFSHGFETRVF